MNFNEEIQKLLDTRDDITTRENLINFSIYNIHEDRLFLAIHILEALNTCDAEFFDYDFCMGTLDTPTPLYNMDDIQDYINK